MRNLEEFYKSLESARGKATADAVRDFTGIYTDGIYKWLAGLWDGEIGGFYYSNSARDTDGYLPDIESTAQAIGVRLVLSSQLLRKKRLLSRLVTPYGWLKTVS